MNDANGSVQLYEESCNWKIYILTLITFMVGTTQFGIVGMLDKIAVSVGVPVSTAGQLITAFALGNAIGTPFVIASISKMNQRRQLMLALGIIVFGILLMLALPGFGFLMFSRAVLGVGTGTCIVTAYGIAAKLASPERRGRVMSNVAMGASSSLVFGVPLGRMVGTAFGWKTIFMITGFLCLIAIFVVSQIIPVLKNEVSTHSGNRLALLKNPRVATALTVTFFVFIGFSIMDTYVTPFLIASKPAMEQNLSAILMILGIGSLIGSKLGGFAADKIGIHRTIFSAVIIQIAALALIPAVSGWGVAPIVLLMIWEISCWMFGPTQNFNLVSLAPEVSGIALSLNSTFVQLGFAAGAGIGGMVVSHWSVLSITWVGAASAVVAFIVFRATRSSLGADVKTKMAA